jgi:hypothetical protein
MQAKLSEYLCAIKIRRTAKMRIQTKSLRKVWKILEFLYAVSLKMYKNLNPFLSLMWQRGIKVYGEVDLFLTL